MRTMTTVTTSTMSRTRMGAMTTSDDGNNVKDKDEDDGNYDHTIVTAPACAPTATITLRFFQSYIPVTCNAQIVHC